MERGDGLEDRVILDTDIVLERTSLSPLAIARGRRAGRMEFKAAEGGTVFLEVGGTLVAEGRIVRKGGKNWLRITRLAAG
ncbi:MAG: hypothetical protein WCL50_09030 [Spirochaetota bacterium]